MAVHPCTARESPVVRTFPKSAPHPVISKMIWRWILYLAIESGSQIVFKIAGADLDASSGLGSLTVQTLTSPWAMGGLLLYGLGFVVWMTILRDVDVGRALPITAASYLTTLAAAVFLFHETLSPLRIAGIVAIIGGVTLLISDRDTPIPE